MQLILWPPTPVTVNTSPIEFQLDGVDTIVNRDTVTPGNSRGLPVVNLDAAGNVATPLTDAQLRATPVPVSGPLTDVQLRAVAVPVSGPLTDSQLRAAAVPVSLASVPLATGAATEAKQDTGNTSLGSIDTKTPALVSGRVPVDGSGVTQPVSAASLPLPTGAATSALQTTGNASLADIDTQTADLPNVIALEGGTQPTKGVVIMGHTGAGVVRHILVENTGRQVIHVTASALPTGAATEAKQDAGNVLLGAVTETAPATDTASSGLNGRLQRIAQRLTSLIALLPASLGQKTMANSLAVTLASDQTVVKVSSGTGAAQSDGGTIANATQGASAATLTAPANAIGFILSADDGNTDNFYFAIGATASLTSGQEMQPGRDSGFVPCGANVSIFGAASNPRYNMQWLTRS